MALMNMKIHASENSVCFSFSLFVRYGRSILKLGWIDLVVVVGFGWFLPLFTWFFDANSICDITMTWTRPLVVRENDFRRVLRG